jgi:4-hydroxyacetophenone monooxygenase
MQSTSRTKDTAMSTVQVNEGDAWIETLDLALKDADIPTLLMVLIQLTGDTNWLSPRFQCRRVKGLTDDDTGGLGENICAEIVAAARGAILRWRSGTVPATVALPHEVLADMMKINTGEQIPAGYGAIIAAGLGQDQAFSLQRRDGFRVPDDFRVLIIGAGIAGLCAAIRLENAGVPYLVIEKNATIGGTWHENRYPGAGVDTPSHIYSYSFAKHDWTMHFALQAEIQSYFEGVADKYNVRPQIRFNTCVESARYDDGSARWIVRTIDDAGISQEFSANILIGAVGVLNTPKLPAIKGLESFTGPCFHTARWPQGLDLHDKRVAVIGNGATAMQVVPAIAGKVRSLIVFQRSKQWAAPFEQFRKPIPSGARFLLREIPFYQEWYRQRLAWIFNDRIHGSLQIDPDWPHPDRSINAQNEKHREAFTAYVKAELGSRQDLLPDVLPDYPPFGKRMLMDNGWYRTLTRDNVRLVTDSITEIAEREIVTRSGARHAADVLVIATGFDAVNMLASFELYGKDGRSIREAWEARGPEAYMGMTIPGFPNFFVLSGPNTGLGHGGSGVAVIESQVRYIMGILEKAIAACGPAFEIEIKRDVFDLYNERIQEAHNRMIWTHKGMSNWYRNAKGRVVVTTPFRNDASWHAARRTDLNDFILARADGASTVTRSG